MPPEQISSPAARTASKRVEAILIGVRGADARIESPACVEVMVDAIHAAGLQSGGLRGREQARRNADFQPMLGLDPRTARRMASRSFSLGRRPEVTMQ